VSAAAAPAAAPAAAAASTQQEEKKEEETEEAAAPAKKTSAPAKLSCSTTRMFGGEGGAPFDDLNHKSIKKINVYSGMLVDAIMVTYENGPAKRHGGDGGRDHSLELSDDEYITSVTIRHSNIVQCLTFVTNKGNKLEGGGKGRPIIDKKGEETEVKAPNGRKLIGINGRAGTFLDAIGLRWGPV
jgi:Jacalin-like lectin domain